MTDTSAVTDLGDRASALESMGYSELSRSLAGAETLEQQALAAGCTDLVMRARIVQADILIRSGRTAAGGRMVRDAHRWAEQGVQDQQVLSRSHIVLARFFRHLGDRQRTLEHAIRAAELTTAQTPPIVRMDHEMMLAIALATTSSFEDARERFLRAEAIAEQHGSPRDRLVVLNNMAYTEYEAGNPLRSLTIAVRMRDLAQEHGLVLQAVYVDTLGRAHLVNGDAAAAQRVLLEVTGPTETVPCGEGDAVARCLLTLAEAQRVLGETSTARQTLDRCLELCAERGLAEVAADAQLERSLLLAAQGRYQEAFEEHRTFFTEWKALYSAERDARARVVQAVFDATEAKRDSERFRELSMHDPLTGLANRRYVEERLPALAQAATARSPLMLAMVDLDHFKRVNDECSHEVGDRVLVHVARFLEEAAAAGFAARMGGEEFLVVVPGLDGERAAELCETLRQRIQDHGWAVVTGEVPVTASIGIALARDGGEDPTALLREADQRLYSAKQRGRNTVVGEPGPTGVGLSPGAGSGGRSGARTSP